MLIKLQCIEWKRLWTSHYFIGACPCGPRTDWNKCQSRIKSTIVRQIERQDHRLLIQFDLCNTCGDGAWPSSSRLYDQVCGSITCGKTTGHSRCLARWYGWEMARHYTRPINRHPFSDSFIVVHRNRMIWLTSGIDASSVNKMKIDIGCCSCGWCLMALYESSRATSRESISSMGFR